MGDPDNPWSPPTAEAPAPEPVQDIVILGLQAAQRDGAREERARIARWLVQYSFACLGREAEWTRHLAGIISQGNYTGSLLPMSRWYKLVGDEIVPCNLFEAAEERDKRWQLKEQLAHCLVSTVFLGLDHQHLPGGPPLVFETMVFLAGSGDDAYCERYETKAEAEAGHRATVERARAGEWMPQDTKPTD